MKKLLVILMSVMLIFALVGCDDKPRTHQQPSATPQESVTPQSTEPAAPQESATPQESASPQPSATPDQSIMLNEFKSVLENLGTKMEEYKSFDVSVSLDVSAKAMGQTQQINASADVKLKDADGAYLMQGVISMEGLTQDGSAVAINMFYDGEYVYMDMSKINGQKIKVPLAVPQMPVLPDVEETETEETLPEDTEEPEDDAISAIKDLLMDRLSIKKDDNYVLTITLSGEDVKTILEATQDEDAEGGVQNALEGTEIKGASLSFAIGLDGYLKGVSFGVGISAKSVVENQVVDVETDMTAVLTLNNTPDQEVEITLPEDLDTYIEGRLPVPGVGPSDPSQM